jgi:methanogenic corrinoid protein MtbC1
VTAFDVLYDTLREHGHRPSLHIIADARGSVERTWLTAAGVGALGGDADQAARLYVEAGAALTADEPLRAELRRLGRLDG